MNRQQKKEYHDYYYSRAPVARRWIDRARDAADLLLKTTKIVKPTILDIGCGAMEIDSFLMLEHKYIPCDFVKRSENCLLVDINRVNDLATLPKVDIVVTLGVLEYAENLESFIKHLKGITKEFCFSYRVDHNREVLNNNYSLKEIRSLVGQFFNIVFDKPTYNNCWLFYSTNN